MKVTARRGGAGRLAAALCLALSFLLTGDAALACSSSYAIWMIRSKDADPLYRFIQDGKTGYIDASGKVVVKPTFEGLADYNSGQEFRGGLLHLRVTEARYADVSGKVVIDKDYSSAWDFSDGLAAALPEGSNRWGFIDRSGEFAISPRFEGYPDGYPYPFSEGLAMIKTRDGYGYIDRSGEFIIKPTLLHGTSFSDGMARVVVEGPCVHYGRGVCPSSETVGKATRRPVTPCKYTFIDKSGAVVGRDRYDYAKDFSEGLAPVMVGSKWGYVDKHGAWVIAPRFDDAEPFSDRMARVTVGRLQGYINREGAFAITPRFEGADDFSEGFAVVRVPKGRDIEWYYIDKSGRQAFPGRFLAASHFFKGLAHVKLAPGGKFGSDSMYAGEFAYIDYTGRKVFTYTHRGEE